MSQTTWPENENHTRTHAHTPTLTQSILNRRALKQEEGLVTWPSGHTGVPLSKTLSARLAPETGVCVTVRSTAVCERGREALSFYCVYSRVMSQEHSREEEWMVSG